MIELLRTEEIVKTYATQKALDKVSIVVPKQSIYGLLGPNGAGKTSLIRIINQITAPDSGQVFLKGEKLHPKHCSIIGYLPEERGLYKKMKVGEQALYLSRLKGLKLKQAEKKLKEWFEKFEIIDWWNRRVEELSKGMQQKIQFIITVLHEPELLIFDEPFTGFDPINASIVKNEIIKLKENGCTIILSTHNMSSVEELCDNIALINKSRKILEGRVDDVRSRYKSNTYLIECKNSVTFFDSKNSDFEVIEHTSDSWSHKYKVKLNGTTTPKDMLKAVLDETDLISFKELLPSMNDIFIKVVQEDINFRENE